MKIDAFVSFNAHNKCIFNMRCTDSNTGQYSNLERILLVPMPYPEIPPFKPPPELEEEDEDDRDKQPDSHVLYFFFLIFLVYAVSGK